MQKWTPSSCNFVSALGQNQLLLTKQSYVQDLLDVFCNYNKYLERGRITVKISGALLYVFQHIVGSSKYKVVWKSRRKKLALF